MSGGTVIDVIESSLGTDLTRKNLARGIDYRTLSVLARRLSDFHEAYELPNKDESQFRPSISPRSEASRGFGQNYVSGPRQFRTAFDYEFDASVQGEMTGNVKRLLLYGHGLVFEDALIYLLDYFTSDQPSDYSVRRTPAVLALLGEYADIKPLIQRNIVIPMADSRRTDSNTPWLPDELRDEIYLQTPGLPRKDFDILLRTVVAAQHRKNQFGGRIDHFFPKPEYVEVYRALLKCSQDKFTSTAISRPNGAQVLWNVEHVNTGVLSVHDVVQMRLNDELFQEWRLFLEAALRRMDQACENSNDPQGEFQIAIRDQAIEWRERIDVRIQRGSLKHSLQEAARGLVIGAGAGVVTGAMTLSPEAAVLTALFAGAAQGVVQPILELGKSAIGANRERNNAISFKHHFMALDLLK